jgi:hypothetical protein
MPFLDARALTTDPEGMEKLRDCIAPRRAPRRRGAAGETGPGMQGTAVAPDLASVLSPDPPQAAQPAVAKLADIVAD